MQSVSQTRLALLARHLAAVDQPSSTTDASLSIAQTAAAVVTDARPAPGGGPGKLLISDSRTGKQYEIAIDEHGHIKGTELKKIVAGGDGVGLRTYDPGYMNTAACRSAISYIDGNKGILRYRGYPIEELVERSSFLEVAYLLVYGDLPSVPQLREWEEAVMRHSALPVDVENVVLNLPNGAHPMGTVLTAINALSTCHPEQNPAIAGQNIYKPASVQDKQIVRLIGKGPTIAAYAYHKLSGRMPSPPNQKLGYAENFLYMLDAGNSPDYRPNPRLARALEVMFILHAEHEMNCSTAAARHLASSGVDVYTAVGGAVGALYGPLHGGANEAVLRMLQRIGTADKIPEFVEKVKARKEILFGFGHRVYKNYDPRATIIRQVAEEVFEICGRDPLIDVALALEKVARSDDYFVQRKLYPNVDFFSGLVYRSMGFPPEYFTVLFAVPRITGYVSHWKEQLTDPDAKIIRPQQDYVGHWLRHYTPVTERPKFATEVFSPIPASNAYRRRIAGTNWQ